MQFYSTQKKSAPVDFKTATIQGQPPDKGLYFPETIPQFDPLFCKQLAALDDADIAYQVMQPYIGNTMPGDELYKIVQETISFPIPLVRVTDQIYSLELFHGPTLAFKDVGARFMSRCLGYFLKDENRKVTVLVATSGDTGGAVANGFYDVEGVDVVILYPSRKVSPVQEKQLTTLGKNIHALEVQGTFDDCQQMVKQAFADEELQKKCFLTSANSINVARWLPQQIYYLLAYKQWEHHEDPVISVPSGNFGNICAGILAMQSGLPVDHFIAAGNINNIVSNYLQTKELNPREASPTLSNAMDVGNPSNFVRILETFNHQFPELKNKLSSVNITDTETVETMADVYYNHDYTLDPHGAVGYLALKRYLEKNPDHRGIFLETAHPVKFPESVEKVTAKKVEMPAALEPLMTATKKSEMIKPDFLSLKEYLLHF